MEDKKIISLKLSNLAEDSKSGIRPIYEEQDRIKALFGQFAGDHRDLFLDTFLCKQEVETDEQGWKKITYSHNKLGDSPITLKNLDKEDKQKWDEKVSQIKEILTIKGNTLRTKGGLDNSKKADWLEKINDSISDHRIWIGNDHMALVAWGLKDAEIIEEHKFLPDTPLSPDKDDLKSEEGDLGKGENEIGGKKKGDLEKKTEVVTQGSPENEDENEPDLPPDPPPPPKIWEKIKEFFKQWWWVLLLIVVLILLLSLLRGCGGCYSPGGEDHLPQETGKLIPIDGQEIIYDRDSLAKIVGDRLNIVLKGSNKDLARFAHEFKQQYPEAGYQVIYYDPRTYRLQIRIPAEEREQVRKDLPSKLPAFDMLIWHESIFYRNRQTNTGSNTRNWYQSIIGANKAWERTRGNPEVIIAVLDDGFDLKHPALKGKAISPYNVFTQSGDVRPGPGEDHGTHVAGLAIGNPEPNTGFSGICPDCSFMPVKISSGSGVISSSSLIDGILYSIYEGADIINLSIQQAFNPFISTLPIGIQKDIVRNNFKEEADFWIEIFNIAADHNTTIVMAAGNLDILIGVDPLKRSSEIINVSALDINLNRADFSNFGSNSTISAPGVMINSSLPGGIYGFENGTSLSAPIVAGGIGLIKSVAPEMSSNEIIRLLRNTGKTLPNHSKEIGPLLQIDAALMSLPGPADDEEIDSKKGRPVDKDLPNCEEIERQIMQLEQQIKALISQCPSLGQPRDTLIIPEDAGDLSFMTGRWRSTTPLHNTHTGEPVVIYFDFEANESGLVSLHEEDGDICRAPLKLSLGRNEIKIEQMAEAICSPGKGVYAKYDIVCYNESGGNAHCVAQNTEISFNRVEFKLIKIN